MVLMFGYILDYKITYKFCLNYFIFNYNNYISYIVLDVFSLWIELFIGIVYNTSKFT